MKKVKIMLLSLALLSVAGGAIAFKARAVGKFCTAEYTGNCNKACPALIINSTTTTDVLPFIVCTTLPTTTFEIPGDPDSPVIPTCTTFNGQVNVTVNCAASATLKGD